MDSVQDFSHIKGWGIDADPGNDPTWPMRKRQKERYRGHDWPRPALQPLEVEVHHSTERPSVSAVFGATLPPHGLSGVIRRLAFRKSENAYAHWLPLLLADRIDMVEGLFDDVMRGKLPNLIQEKGLRADWQHDRARLVAKTAVGAVAAVAVWRCLSRRE